MYYFQGFYILVEREWLQFGHKFADRCGHDVNTDDPNERCPVFLQWLDCVHQIYRQFPCAFEFSEAFLVSFHGLCIWYLCFELIVETKFSCNAFLLGNASFLFIF